MRLYFIRHAQSHDNVQLAKNAVDEKMNRGGSLSYGNLTGDPELSEAGYKQAGHVAEFMAGQNERSRMVDPQKGNRKVAFGITHVYASYMVRSMETAGAIATALSLTPMIMEDLHETGGMWAPDEKSGQLIGQPGNNRAFFEERFPYFKLPDRLDEQGWWNRPVETSQEIKDRALRFCSSLIEKHGETDDRVIIVGHGFFYSFILNTLLKITPKSKVRFSINNTGITRLDYQNGSTSVIYMNRLEHLPEDLVTA